MSHRGRLACSEGDEVGLNKSKKPGDDIPKIMTCRCLSQAPAKHER